MIRFFCSNNSVIQNSKLIVRVLSTEPKKLPNRKSKEFRTLLVSGAPFILFLMGGFFFLTQFMGTHVEMKVNKVIIFGE